MSIRRQRRSRSGPIKTHSDEAMFEYVEAQVNSMQSTDASVTPEERSRMRRRTDLFPSTLRKNLGSSSPAACEQSMHIATAPSPSMLRLEHLHINKKHHNNVERTRQMLTPITRTRARVDDDDEDTPARKLNLNDVISDDESPPKRNRRSRSIGTISLSSDDAQAPVHVPVTPATRARHTRMTEYATRVLADVNKELSREKRATNNRASLVILEQDENNTSPTAHAMLAHSLRAPDAQPATRATAVTTTDKATSSKHATFNRDDFRELEMAGCGVVSPKRTRGETLGCRYTPNRSKKIFEGVVAFADVIVGDVNMNSIIEHDIRRGGGEVVHRLCNRVTHVIFDNGRERTWNAICELCRKLRANGRILHIVNGCWVIDSLEKRRRMDTEKYTSKFNKPADEDLRALLPGGSKRRYVRRVESLKKTGPGSRRKLVATDNNTKEKLSPQRQKLFLKTSPEQKNMQATKKVANERMNAQGSQRSDVTTYADITAQQERLDKELDALRNDIRTLRSQRVDYIEEEDELMSSNDNMSLMDRVRKHLAEVDIVDASPATRATAAHGPSPLARHMTATPSINDATSCSSVNAEQPYIALVRPFTTTDSSGASDQSKRRQTRRHSYVLTPEDEHPSPIRRATNAPSPSQKKTPEEQANKGNMRSVRKKRAIQEHELDVSLQHTLSTPEPSQQTDNEENCAVVGGHKTLAERRVQTTQKNREHREWLRKQFYAPDETWNDSFFEESQPVTSTNMYKTPESRGSYVPKARTRSSKVQRKSNEGKKSRRNSHNKQPIVLTSMSQSDREACVAITRLLGGFCITAKVTEATTHVIAKDPQHTLNALYAVAYGCWLVSPEWIYRSVVTRKWESPEAYEWSTEFPGAKERRLEMQEHARITPLYDDTVGTVYVARDVRPPQNDLARLAEAIGLKIVPTVSRSNIVLLSVLHEVPTTYRRRLDALQEATSDSSILSPNALRRSSGTETEERLTFVDTRWVIDSLVQNRALSYEQYIIDVGF